MLIPIYYTLLYRSERGLPGTSYKELASDYDDFVLTPYTARKWRDLTLS
jgi:hypothetical protein